MQRDPRRRPGKRGAAFLCGPNLPEWSLRTGPRPVRPEEDIPMIAVGTKAPDFTLPDHLGRKVSLATLLGKRHVMLLFYPLDFTPT